MEDLCGSQKVEVSETYGFMKYSDNTTATGVDVTLSHYNLENVNDADGNRLHYKLTIFPEQVTYDKISVFGRINIKRRNDHTSPEHLYNQKFYFLDCIDFYKEVNG